MYPKVVREKKNEVVDEQPEQPVLTELAHLARLANPAGSKEITFEVTKNSVVFGG